MDPIDYTEARARINPDGSIQIGFLPYTKGKERKQLLMSRCLAAIERAQADIYEMTDGQVRETLALANRDRLEFVPSK